MKKHFDSAHPPEIVRTTWKNEFPFFHWLYHLINHPNFTFFITTYKDNGKNNVCLHAWGFVDSDPTDTTYFILAISKNGHTFQNIHRVGVFCINYQTQENPALGQTVLHNAFEDDEIDIVGLTAEPCVMIEAPKIAECGLNLECEMVWEKDIPNSNKTIITSQVRYVTVEEALLAVDYRKKLRAFETGLCYTRQINPVTGEMNPVGGDGKLDPDLFKDW